LCELLYYSLVQVERTWRNCQEGAAVTVTQNKPGGGGGGGGGGGDD